MCSHFDTDYSLHGDAGGAAMQLAPGEAWERRQRCRKQLETFRWNPAGNQSRPVELGQQREASLASVGENRGAKRRQRVPKLCDSASKGTTMREPSSCCKRGPRRRTVMAWVRRSYRGPRAWHRHYRVLQEPGRSCRSPSANFGVELPNPKAPRPSVGVGPEGSEDRRTGRVSPSEGNEARRNGR